MKDWQATFIGPLASAIVYALATDETDSGGSAPRDIAKNAHRLNATARLIVQRFGAMPQFLSLPLAVLSWLFNLHGIILRGRRFVKQNPDMRLAQIRWWRTGPFSFMRDFIRFYETLFLFGFYSFSDPGAAGIARPSTNGHSAAAGQQDLDCDVLVIGSGPGGAITAAQLAAAGRNVILVEEGGRFPLSPAFSFSLDDAEMKMRHAGLTVTLGKTKVAYVEGRCVGGGSEINAGLYHRLPTEVQESWIKEYGLRDFDLTSQYEKIEKDLAIARLPFEADAASVKLKKGAESQGWQAVEVPRWFEYKRAENGVWSAQRRSMSATYIPRALAAGCRLLEKTRIRKIVISGGRAQYAVAQTEAAGAPVNFQIRFKNVFVCGGAIQTPALLRRSGVCRHIGNSLHMHPMLKVVARFADPVNSEAMGIPVHQVKNLAPRLSFGCSVSAPAYLAVALAEQSDGRAARMNDWRHWAVYYVSAIAARRGKIRNAPGFASPLVFYPLTRDDLSTLAEGAAHLGRLLFGAGAEEIIFPVRGYAPARQLKDLDVFRRPLPAGAVSLNTVHIFGSCPMGEKAEVCPVDSYGKLRGHENIFINDGSLLPSAPGVNPQGTIMAIAHRNVAHFLQTPC